MVLNYILVGCPCQEGSSRLLSNNESYTECISSRQAWPRLEHHTSASVFQLFQIKALLKVFLFILFSVKIIQCTVSLFEIVNKCSYKTLLNISCTQLIHEVKHACLSLKSSIHPLQSLDLRHLLGKLSDLWWEGHPARVKMGKQVTIYRY